MIRRRTLVTGGCSFSDNWNSPESKYLYRRTWVNYIKEKYNFKKYVHMGNPASGNELIAERVVYALQTLLDKGYLSDDLYVGVMWSGIERKELFVSAQETDKYSELDDSVKREGENTLIMSNRSNVFSNTKDVRPGIVNVPNGYLKSGGLPYTDDWWKTKPQRDYFNLWYDNFYSVEKQFIDTLKSILLVQTFCERHNIKYFMSVWQNIFSARNSQGDLPPKSYGDDCVESRLKPKFVDIFNKSSRFSWNSIYFNKFIFYENDKVVYGEITK